MLQTTEAPNGVTKHEAKSSLLTTSATTDEAKSQLVPTSLQVSSVAEQKPGLERAGKAADSATVVNGAASGAPNASTGSINIPSGRKPDAPSGTQAVTKQNTIPGLSGSKYADPAPSGLSVSKYASPAPSGLSASKYAAPAPGLSASKYASPAPSGLSASKYAAPQAPGLSASKYATAAAPGLSASRYATNGSDSTSSTVNGAPASSGLSGSKYSDMAPPRIASSGVLSSLASSKYAPDQLRAAANKEMMKPQNPATQTEIPAVPGKEKEVNEIMGTKEVIKEIVDTKETKQDRPAIKGATTLENDAAVQVPMSASQRLLDSIAARYKFASPKQVSGLARRYGTIIVATKDSPTKSITPQEREIDDATRAFQALFISRGRRVFRQPV